MAPGPRGVGVTFVPILPPVVVLGAEPYYVQGEYYYYYQNNGWYYSRSRGGPWIVLPRDHYPREVRVVHDGAAKNAGRKPESAVVREKTGEAAEKTDTDMRK